MSVLDLEEIGIEDDFMELGGDSLAAEELLTAVSETFGVDLPSSTLINSPTLREFAWQVEYAPRATAVHPTMITLRAEAKRPPLFFSPAPVGSGCGSSASPAG
jgi:acyl carrier protein